MRRRELLALAGTAVASIALSAYSQRPRWQKPLLVWYQSGGVFPNRFSNALFGGLADLGIAEGRAFDVDYRNANNQPELMPALPRLICQSNFQAGCNLSSTSKWRKR